MFIIIINNYLTVKYTCSPIIQPRGLSRVVFWGFAQLKAMHFSLEM